MMNRKTRALLLRRRKTIEDWLAAAAPYSFADQRHLDGGTPEQAYWNYGYLSALTDVLSLVSGEERKPRSADKSS